jgi:hypothetical protein
MHPMLSFDRRRAAVAAASVLSAGVALAGPSIPARAAAGAVAPPSTSDGQSPTEPSHDTTTVTTTCTTGLIIVLASPFSNIPCYQPFPAGGTFRFPFSSLP